MSQNNNKPVKRKPVKTERKNYPMNNSKTKSRPPISEKPKFRLHRGKKKDVRLTVFVAISALIVIAGVYFIILAFHPIGVGEFFSSKFKTSGNGNGFNIELKGEDTLSVHSEDGYFYTVTETQVVCNNFKGKLVSTVDHGFARPVLYSSETRYIIFGQGEQTVKVYNFDEELHNLHFESTILGASIADNGNFAVITTADGYDSAITVYNKNGKVLYEWYSSKGIVSSVRFLPNEKEILVTLISASDGELSTRILILNFKSAEAEKTFEFKKELCYNTHFLSKDMVAVVFEDSIKFINLKDDSVVIKAFEYSVKLAEPTENYLLISGNLDSNTDKNHITLYNKKGECVSEFSVDFSVKRAVYKSKHLYLLSDTFVNCYSIDGNLLYTASVTFDVRHIVPIDDKNFVAVSNNLISKVDFEQTE